MIKNYIKIAWRSLNRSRAFAITNLLGLTIGITCTIFIFLWVRNELTYDKYHANYKTIYKVIANRDFKNTIFTDHNMVFPLAKNTKGGFAAALLFYPTTFIQFSFSLNSISRPGP